MASANRLSRSGKARLNLEVSLMQWSGEGSSRHWFFKRLSLAKPMLDSSDPVGMPMPKEGNSSATRQEGPELPRGLPAISPDLIEQELAEEIDNIVPTHGYEMLPMVGLGGSAGSIPALKQFFENMPPASGMVFV